MCLSSLMDERAHGGTNRDIMGKWKGILRRTRKERMDEREGERMGNVQDYTAGEQERKP